MSKRKVFKKQLIVCIKRLRQFCGIKKYPKKNRVVRTTHGRRRTYKFICPPPTMRCTYNKPFSSKLLTLQGNGTHSDASFVMLYHIPDLEPNRRQKICPVAKGLKGFATFWEFSFYGQKRCLIVNITVFLLKKFIFILNFSI